MTRWIRLSLPVLAVTLLVAGAAPAWAAPSGDGTPHAEQNGKKPKKTRSAPEFDPAAAGAIVALLAGGGVLIARRRRR